MLKFCKFSEGEESPETFWLSEDWPLNGTLGVNKSMCLLYFKMQAHATSSSFYGDMASHMGHYL